jgi:hypothetical protein
LRGESAGFGGVTGAEAFSESEPDDEDLRGESAGFGGATGEG